MQRAARGLERAARRGGGWVSSVLGHQRTSAEAAQILDHHLDRLFRWPPRAGTEDA